MSRTTLAHATAAHVQFAFGDFVGIRRYPARYESTVEVRFKNVRVDMSEDTLRDLIREGQEVLAIANDFHSADLSGAAANIEETA